MPLVGKACEPAGAVAVAAPAGCCSFCARDATIYIPKYTSFQRFHGLLKPADFCCSCCCCKCCCGCCECCDLRVSVCCAAAWQFVVGGVLGGGYAAVTALSFHIEPSFLEVNTQIVALMIHLLVFWWLYFLTGIVGCCTALDRQGILTYDPRVLFMSRAYVGLNVLCAVCHVTLALLNKGLWGAPLTRINIFVTFLPLAWDWYILYLAWSLARKLREQRKGIFRGRPVMAHQRKPGQLLELHSGHNLSLSPPPNQGIVPLTAAATRPNGAAPYAPGDAAPQGAALRRSALGTRWSAPSVDILAYASDGAVAAGRGGSAAATAAVVAAPQPNVMERSSPWTVAANGAAARWDCAQTLPSGDEPGAVDGGSETGSTWKVTDSSFSGNRGGGSGSLGAGARRSLRQRQVMASDGEEEAGDDELNGSVVVGGSGGGGDGGSYTGAGGIDNDREDWFVDVLQQQQQQQQHARAPVSLLPMPPASVPLPPIPPPSEQVPGWGVSTADCGGLGGGFAARGNGSGAAGWPVAPDALAAIQEEEAAITQRLSLLPSGATQQHPLQGRRLELGGDQLQQQQKQRQKRRRRITEARRRRRVVPHGDDDNLGPPRTSPLPNGPGAAEPPSPQHEYHHQNRPRFASAAGERRSDLRKTAAYRPRAATHAVASAVAPMAAPPVSDDAADAFAPSAVFELRLLSSRPLLGSALSGSSDGLSGQPVMAAMPSSSSVRASQMKGGARRPRQPSVALCTLAGARPNNPMLPTLEPVVLSVPAQATCGSALFNGAAMVGAGPVTVSATSGSEPVLHELRGDGTAPAAGLATLRKPSLSRRALFLHQLSLQRSHALLHPTPAVSSTTPGPAAAAALPLANAQGLVPAPAEPPRSPRHPPIGPQPAWDTVAVRMRDSDLEQGPELPPRRTPPPLLLPVQVGPAPAQDSTRAMATASFSAAIAGPDRVSFAPSGAAAAASRAAGGTSRAPNSWQHPYPSATLAAGQVPLPPLPPPPKLPQGRQRSLWSVDGAVPTVPLQQQQQQGLGQWPQSVAANGAPVGGRSRGRARSVQGSSGGTSDGGGTASDGGDGGGRVDGWRRTGDGSWPIHASSSAKTLQGAQAWAVAPATAKAQLVDDGEEGGGGGPPPGQEATAVGGGGARARPRVPPLQLQHLRLGAEQPLYVQNKLRPQSYSMPSYQPGSQAGLAAAAAAAKVAAATGVHYAAAVPTTAPETDVWYGGGGAGCGIDPQSPGRAAAAAEPLGRPSAASPGLGTPVTPGPHPAACASDHQHRHPPHDLEPPPPSSQGQRQYAHNQHLLQQRQLMGTRGAGGARATTSSRFRQQNQQQQQHADPQASGSGGGRDRAGSGAGAIGAATAGAGDTLKMVNGLATRAGASAAALWGVISGDWRTQAWEEQQHGPGEAAARVARPAAAPASLGSVTGGASFWATTHGRAGDGARDGGEQAAAAQLEATPRARASSQPAVGVGPAVGGSLASLLSPLGLPAVATAARDGARAVYDRYGTYLGRAVRGTSVGEVLWGTKPAVVGSCGSGDGADGGSGGGVAAVRGNKEGSCSGGGDAFGGGAVTRLHMPMTPVAEITPFPGDI